LSMDLKTLKSKFLELLKSDEEFRYVVAGFIGLDRVLNELKKLREDFNKLYQKSLEHDKRFEEINRRFEEINKRFEIIEKKLLEHDKRFEEINKRFEAIETKLLDHDRKFEEVIHRLNRVELEPGALNESFYCRVLWEDLREELRERGEEIALRRRNARVDDEDIDLLIVTDKRVYVVEAKVKPRYEDVGRLLAKVDVVKKHYRDKEVIAILTGAMIGRGVEEYAREKNVKVYNY